MNYRVIAEQIGPRVGATQEWVFRVLRSGIITGEIPGGTQLKQDEISAALNVSHIPVREALRRLESLGLVTIHPNRGASVASLSRSTLLDMMEVRATLSVMTYKNGAPLLTSEEFAELDAILEAQRHETDLFKTEELNYHFHDLLGKHADNSVANLFMSLIHDNIDRYLRKNFYSTEETRAPSIAQHEKILALTKAGKYDEAAELLKAHILDAKSLIPDTIQ